MSYFRPEIEAIAGYVPGEQPQAGKFIKLNTNENPYPPSPAVARAIAAVLERGLSRYPDPMADGFRRRAAEVLGVEPDWILCGNGSDDILTIVTRALVGAGEWLRLPYPSYILYKTLAQLQGASAEEIRFEPDWSLSDKFAAPRADLKLAFLANPNSPSGTMLAAGARAGIGRAAPLPAVGRRGLRRLRRAELPVAGGPQRQDHGLALAEQIVCAGRTAIRFSGGAAALDRRVREGEGLVQLRRAVDRRRDRGHRRSAPGWPKTGPRSCATRARLVAGMRELGFATVDSQANFVWNPHPKMPVRPLYEKLKAERILVRYMDYSGWGDGLRISVGTDDQIDACLAAAADDDLVVG